MKLLASLAALCLASTAQAADAPITIVIHGGAGAQAPGRYTAEEEAAYIAKLNEALETGYAIMEDGGSAVDAIVATIALMEDYEGFNAGKGAVFTREGKNELDSSIMDGATRNAGSVAGVTTVKNPIKLARAVMENSPHVMFARSGAEAFAKAQGLEIVPPDYFFTQKRFDALQDALAAEQKKEGALPADFKYGTVGAVALDGDGNLAAGTSTGGITKKDFGRVGDSPIIGAGTYADNGSCAVSATGQGEYFIRLTIARDICAQVEYAGKTVSDAAHDMIDNRLTDMGAEGGVIALAPNGDYAMVFNTLGMFRGVKTGDKQDVAIYRDEN